MSERNYKFYSCLQEYEDQLPDDMTDADYNAWFDLSHVDIVRIGPWPVRLASPAGAM